MDASTTQRLYSIGGNIFGRGLLSALLLIAVAARVAAAEPKGLNQFVEQVMKEYNTPGVSLGVLKDGKVVVLRGYGVRRHGTMDKVDEHTLFQIASCTKSFTAATLATLVDEGKLSWDDPVIEHLPELTLHDLYATRSVTCRDLLAHRSGLPAFTGDLLERFGYDRKEILHRIRYVEPACSLRERANYSNLGFFSAGMTASRVGGASWDELVQQRLLQPLDMKRSGTSYKDRDRYDNVAEAHIVGSDGQLEVIPWENVDTLGPAGSMTSTAADMVNWMQMLLAEGKFNGKQIVSSESVREMFRPAIVSHKTIAESPPIDEHAGFCFTMGWGNFHYEGYEVIEKGGARAGVRATVVLVPEKKLGIVVLANMSLTVVPEAIRAYLLEAYVAPAKGNVQAGIRETDRELKKIFSPAPTAVANKAPPSLPLEKYTGIYKNRLYGKVVVKLTNGKLRWAGGRSGYGGPLEHVSYDNFELHFPKGTISLPSAVTFTIKPQGIPSALESDVLGKMTFVDP